MQTCHETQAPSRVEITGGEPLAGSRTLRARSLRQLEQAPTDPSEEEEDALFRSYREPSGEPLENGEEQAGAKSPDKTPQPEELTKNLFKLPENVGSNYLFDVDEGNIKFLLSQDDFVNLDPNNKAGLRLLQILCGQPVYIFKNLQDWKVALETELGMKARESTAGGAMQAF